MHRYDGIGITNEFIIKNNRIHNNNLQRFKSDI